MKSINFKKLLPHLIAVVVFLVVTLIFCKPAIESDAMLKQGDNISWQAMSHQSFEYKAKHGHFPLWSVSMFSGMPAFQIAMEGAWSPLSTIDLVFQLFLPKPFNFFYLACICFYFMCICFRIRPFIAILTSIAFTYCSFSPIIVTAGHDTQMLALAYAPAVIGSVVLLFNRHYLTGFALTSLFTALQIGQGHQQITYYLFLVLAAMTVSYIIHYLRNKEMTHLVKSLGAMVVAGIIGVAVNALVLMTTFDFAKESKRGGQLIMDEKAVGKTEKLNNGKTTGLSRDYAFMWSYGITETWSLLFPGVMGYGTHYAERDGETYLFPKLDEKSNTFAFLVDKLNVGEDQATNFAMQQSSALYWGDQPFTNGPVYLGAITCFLFLLSMFVLDGKHKWWILAIGVLGIMLAWGKNFPGFNYFLFDNFPFYNKLRVPTMALVIPQLVFPIAAALGLEKALTMDKAMLWKKFLLTVAATGICFALAGFIYIGGDFSKENRQRTTAFNKIIAEGGDEMEQKMDALNEKQKPLMDNQLYEGMVMNFKGEAESQKTAREFVTAIRKDRAALLLGDITRSFIFILIAALLIALFIKNKINETIVVVGLTVVLMIDQLGFGMKYLNDKSFGSKSEHENDEFPITEADRKMLDDKDPNFRVFNTASMEEARTSYHHKSIGGYHPAKIGIYDDLIAYQLSGSPNIAVVNMLNAKYILQQQGGNKVALPNPGAMGNAWFVKGVKFVKGPVAEMKALDNLNPADSAVVDESFKNSVGNFVAADSSASIKMTKFDNDAITYQSNGNGSHIAVFSEIYYKDWNATIDGKPASIFKANYVLRGLNIPAGQHTIEFKFEPPSYYRGRSVSNITTWVLMLLIVLALFFEWKRKTAKQ